MARSHLRLSRGSKQWPHLVFFDDEKEQSITNALLEATREQANHGGRLAVWRIPPVLFSRSLERAFQTMPVISGCPIIGGRSRSRAHSFVADRRRDQQGVMRVIGRPYCVRCHTVKAGAQGIQLVVDNEQPEERKAG